MLRVRVERGVLVVRVSTALARVHLEVGYESIQFGDLASPFRKRQERLAW